MIFVTVGTHEQQFNRLVKKIDELKRDKKIEEDIFIQTGYSTYEPKFCNYKSMLSYDEMEKMYKNAHIIIAHGGTGTYMSILRHNKVPIIVPRNSHFGEHINNHQLEFYRKMSKMKNNIILVEDIEELVSKIENYDDISAELRNENISNNLVFCSNLTKKIEKLYFRI